MTNPAIEQAVKVLEQCKTCIDVMYQLLIEELGNNQTLSKLAQSADDNCEQAITSLRAMQQEPSKTDEELGRTMGSNIVDRCLQGVNVGQLLSIQNNLAQAFAMVRKEGFDAAIRSAGNVASGYSEAAADAIYSLKGR